MSIDWKSEYEAEHAKRLTDKERYAALEARCRKLEAKLEVSEAASRAAVSKAEWQARTNHEMNESRRRIAELEAALRMAAYRTDETALANELRFVLRGAYNDGYFVRRRQSETEVKS